MKKISLIASAVALTFGFAACAPELPGILDPLGITEKDDDSSSTPASTTTPTPTTASVAALTAGGAITNTPDITATPVVVTTASGTFRFTKSSVSAFVSNRAADSSSNYNGNWEFTPAVATNPSYKGTFTGTVTSPTAYTAILTVTECKRPEDTEYRVVYASPSPVTFNFTVANSTLTAEIPAISVVVPTTPTTPTTPTDTSTQTSSITGVANEDKTYSATLYSYNVTINTTSTGSYTAAYGGNTVQSGRYKTYTVTGIPGISKILVAKENAQPEDAFDYTTTEGIEVFIVNEGTLTRPTSDQLTALAALKNSSGTQTSGGSGTETPAVQTVTTDSWDFVKTATDSKQSVIGKEFSGFFYVKKANGDYRVATATTILDATDAATTFAIDGANYTYNNIYNVSSAMISVPGASTSLTLIIADYHGSGIGKSKVGRTEAALPSVTSGTGLSSEPKALAFKAKSDAGLLIKNDALVISGVRGAVKLTIDWYLASVKSAGNRNLEVTVGEDGTTVETPNGTEKAQTAYTVSFDGGEAGKNVYIGASNEILIKSIKIEAQ